MTTDGNRAFPNLTLQLQNKMEVLKNCLTITDRNGAFQIWINNNEI